MSVGRPVPLDLIFPRPVLVTLAGEPRKASELDLGSLATLQSWLRQAAPHPLADLPLRWQDPEPGTRRDRLLAAWHAAKAYPPLVGSPDDRDYLDTDEGRAVFLVLCLGKWDEAFTAEDAYALAARMDASDWSRLRAVAWGVAPWRTLAAELDDAWAEEQARKSLDLTDWGEVIVDVIKATGLDFAVIEKWTPTQAALLCSGGKLAGYRATMKSGEGRQAFEARMVRTFSPEPEE